MPNHKIRIHNLAKFDRSAKVRWLLTELGVPFETHTMSRDAKENEQPAYLKLNPLGRVPTVEIDDHVMFESGAICTHLSDLYAHTGIIPKAGTPDRAIYEQWMYFAHNFLDTMQAKIMIIEDIPPGEYQKAKESSVQADLEDACVALDRGLAKGDYLVANRFSAADICMGYHLYFLRMWPELDQVIVKHPRVVAYLDKLKAMPSAVKAEVFSFPQ
jgi:glutathione S-transferase